MKILRSIPVCALAGALFSCVAMAQSVAPTVRIVTPIDESQLVTLKGNVNPHANAQNDRGAVSAGLPLPDLTLVLSRSPEQQAAFDAFVAGQYDPGSPNYHHWLTPAQIGVQFGPAQADIAKISSWLSSQGFAVKSVSPDGMTIRFAGTAGTVQSAFHTEIHNLSVHGVAHYANMTDPQIPAALAPVVVGIKALHNFLPRPMHKLGSLVQFNAQKGKWQRVVNSAAAASTHPALSAALAGSATTSPSALSALPTASLSPRPFFGENGNLSGGTYLEEDVTPNDFATIYNVTPAWNAGYTGTGQTIAIAGTSEINLPDVATYRSSFGLPAGLTPIETDTKLGPAASICTSTSPTAYCGIGDLEENSLDVEVSGAVATGAQINLVVTGQNTSGSIDTVYDSASYIVSNQLAKILSVSYGECELAQGTAENVAYYDLWQSAAAEGISVFVATGDSGSPSCDEDQDEFYGNPYVAQYGLSVSGMASTPFNTAVGGTDFSWCQPYYSGSASSPTFNGCASSSTSQGSPAYWNTSNASTGASAAGYVPEVPWNDTCESPIQARYLQTLLSVTGADSGVSASTPEQTCSLIYSGWAQLDEYIDGQYGFDPGLETWVDTVGGSGGVSGCVVNSTNPDSTTGTLGACSTGATSTGATQGSIPLVNDGWPSPSWQSASGVTGTSGLTARAIPDVSFFAGNGALDSATLICVSNLGACTYNASVTNQTQENENTAQEVGGTSVATPEMAGVMALIDQKAKAPQGLANPELYKLASQQNYTSCSAESVKNSGSCYFQDIDNALTAPSGPAYVGAETISMPCNLTGTPEGGDLNGEYGGLTSPNCYAMNSGDVAGTLGTSSTAAAYNSTTGFDLATGLGSLNVANVVNAWQSDAGSSPATLG